MKKSKGYVATKIRANTARKNPDWDALHPSNWRVEKNGSARVHVQLIPAQEGSPYAVTFRFLSKAGNLHWYEHWLQYAAEKDKQLMVKPATAKLTADFDYPISAVYPRGARYLVSFGGHGKIGSVQEYYPKGPNTLFEASRMARQYLASRGLQWREPRRSDR